LSDNEIAQLQTLIKTTAKSDTKAAIALCSGRFDFEKELFVGWYKVGKLALSKLQIVYPDFAVYLSDYKYDSWANDYIQAYKHARSIDRYTDEIKKIIAEKNASEKSFWEWYDGFESTTDLLDEEQVDKVYCIDGLGIEYLSLINDIISKSDFRIAKLKIAKSDFPLNDECCGFENVTRLNGLDEYIHSEPYKYPSSICKEIEIVKTMFAQILNQADETTIAIVSAHGLTALSRLVSGRNCAANVIHEGRCIKPDSEVYGGCTPEEILTPFIVISEKT
jgi:hypothetical protein